MATIATTVWEVRTTGAATNGGGFDSASGGTDYSQQDAPQAALTDAVANGSTTITSAAGLFTAAMVGNYAYLAGGSGSLAATRRRVTAFTDANTVTVDAAVATGTGIAMNVGGAADHLATINSLLIAGNVTWIKAGNYTHTAQVSLTSTGTTANQLKNTIVGYAVTRGDDPAEGSRPVLVGTTAAMVILQILRNTEVHCVDLDGGDTAATGVQSSLTNYNGSTITNMTIRRCTTNGVLNMGAMAVNVRVTDMTAGATACWATINATAVLVNCQADNSPCPGFSGAAAASTVSLDSCVAANLTGASSDGFSLQAAGVGHVVNCIAVNCGRDGFRYTTYDGVAQTNCIAWNNAGTNLNFANVRRVGSVNVSHNAVGGSGADRANVLAGPGDVALSANPFVDSDTLDFRLNSAAGGGAMLKQVGFPSLVGIGASYPDIGPAQVQAAAGGTFTGTLMLMM